MNAEGPDRGRQQEEEAGADAPEICFSPCCSSGFAAVVLSAGAGVGGDAGEATDVGTEGTSFTRNEAALLMIRHRSSVTHTALLQSSDLDGLRIIYNLINELYLRPR